jgi:hypothetical protein
MHGMTHVIITYGGLMSDDDLRDVNAIESRVTGVPEHDLMRQKMRRAQDIVLKEPPYGDNVASMAAMQEVTHDAGDRVIKLLVASIRSKKELELPVKAYEKAAEKMEVFKEEYEDVRRLIKTSNGEWIQSAAVLEEAKLEKEMSKSRETLNREALEKMPWEEKKGQLKILYESQKSLYEDLIGLAIERIGDEAAARAKTSGISIKKDTKHENDAVSTLAEKSGVSGQIADAAKGLKQVTETPEHPTRADEEQVTDGIKQRPALPQVVPMRRSGRRWN